MLDYAMFFPAAIAFGSSAIVEVSGQNCFPTLLVLWGRSILGRQKVPRKVPPRFQQGCTKVPQVLQVSWCLWFSGADPSWASRFHAKFHQGSTKVSFSAIVKALGQNDTFVFWGSLQQMAVASKKVLEAFPQTVLYIGLTVSGGFLGKWLLLQKRFCGGFRQLFFTFVSQMAVAS